MTKQLAKDIRQEQWYRVMLEELLAIATQRLINSRLELIEGKWEFGKRICEENENFERAKIYGRGIVKAIAEDIGRSESDINYCVQFFKKYPFEDFPQVVANLPPQEGQYISWNKIRTKYLPASPGLKRRSIPSMKFCKKCGGYYLEPLDKSCTCRYQKAP